MDDRPLVVLLPGLGLDSSMYEPLARALPGHADVIAIDLPGFGRPPAEPSHLDVCASKDVLHLLSSHVVSSVARIGRRPAILGGLSLGGTLAIMAARAVGPQSLLLFAPGGLRVAPARRDAITAAMADEAAEPFARRSLGVDAADYESSRFRDHFRDPAPDARAYYEHLVRETWAPARSAARAAIYRALLRAALDVDLEAQLAENELPADLVWGEEDRVFPARTRKRYAATLRAASLHLLPGVGHFAPLEAPDAVARIVSARIAGLASVG